MITYKKHLFFITKNKNWDAIPEDRRITYINEYLSKNVKSLGKLQDLARWKYNNPGYTSEQLLMKACETALC